MKKIIALIILAAMTLTMLASCGGSSKTYIVLDDNFGAEEYAIGFRKDDYALAAKVQEILDEMGKDGAAATISEKWFGTNIVILEGYGE